MFNLSGDIRMSQQQITDESLAEYLIRLAVHLFDGGWTLPERFDLAVGCFNKLEINSYFDHRLDGVRKAPFISYFDPRLDGVRKTIGEITYSNDPSRIPSGFSGSYGIGRIQIDSRRLREGFDKVLQTDQRNAWLKAHGLDGKVLGIDGAIYLDPQNLSPQIRLF